MRRLFVAIGIKPALQAFLEASQPRYMSPSLRFQSPSQFHITVLFMGNIAEAKLMEVEELITLAALDTAPFEMGLKEITPGPGHRNQRLVWALMQFSPEFDAMVYRLREDLGGFMEQEEGRPPKAHITLARKRKGEEMPANLPRMAPQQAIRQRIHQIELWESRRTHEGVVYDCLSKFPLSRLD